MNTETFAGILEHQGPRIYQYIRKILRHAEDAEDVYQNVFIAFYEKVDDVHPEAIEAYLFRAAYNQSINFIKSKQRRKEADFPEYLDIPAPEHDDNPIQTRKNEAIREAFLRLAENEAAALHLQFYEQKSYREIAGIMDLTESAVESLLVRAKRKLRNFLAQEMQVLGVIVTEVRGEK